jgi:hypothetical protein
VSWFLNGPFDRRWFEVMQVSEQLIPLAGRSYVYRWQMAWDAYLFVR